VPWVSFLPSVTQPTVSTQLEALIQIINWPPPFANHYRMPEGNGMALPYAITLPKKKTSGDNYSTVDVLSVNQQLFQSIEAN